jgi:HD-like signal output (HDOD) protein
MRRRKTPSEPESDQRARRFHRTRSHRERKAAHAEISGLQPMTERAESEQRKAAVLAIVAEGLPPMPDHLRQLNALLGANPIDLKRVASAIRSDRQLISKLFGSSEPLHAGERVRAKRVEEAAILMGTQRLKNLVFANYLLRLAGDRLREGDREQFWNHSLSAAVLSEALARATSYDELERAYLGGLLHDAGKLPLLMVAASGGGGDGGRNAFDNPESLQCEREFFGFDHCQVGRGLGVTWNFDPGLIEVLEWHHEPERARFDPELVGIVATADHFLELTGVSPNHLPFALDDFYRACFPRLRDEEIEDMVSLLGREYARIRRQGSRWFEEAPLLPTAG